MHDFPGLKPACSSIWCDSTVGVILFRIPWLKYVNDSGLSPYFGDLVFSEAPLTSCWCATWLVLTKHGCVGVVGSLEMLLVVVVVYPLP